MADVVINIKSQADDSGFKSTAFSIKTMEGAAFKGANAIALANAAAQAASGNFEGAARAALSLAAQMKLLSAVQIAGIGVAIAAISAALKWLEGRARAAAEEIRALDGAKLDNLVASAESADKSFRKLLATLASVAKLEEARDQARGKVRSASAAADAARLEKERQSALAKATTPEERDAVNREFDRRKDALELARKAADVDAAAQANQRKALEAQRKREALEGRLRAAEAAQAKIRGEMLSRTREFASDQSRREGWGAINRFGFRLDAAVGSLFGADTGDLALEGASLDDAEKDHQAKIQKLETALRDAQKAGDDAAAALRDLEAEDIAIKAEKDRLALAQDELAAIKAANALKHSTAEADARAEQAAKDEAATAREREEAEKRIAQAKGEVEKKQKELAALEKQSAADAARAREQELKDALENARRIAGLSVAENVERRRNEKDAAAALEKEEERAERLEGKAARGIRLSKRDAEWLAARKEIEDNRRKEAAAAAALKANEDARRREQLNKITECANELGTLNAKLKELLECA